MAQLGDIYKVLVDFDDIKIAKSRPAIIINIKDNCYIIVEITTKKHNGYYDQFKIPISQWRQAHLNKPSYFKTDKLHKITSDKLYEYIGHASESDILNCQTEVIKTIKALTHR